MYSKHNDKQIGNDQSFCSYCGNNSKIIVNEHQLKDQEYYKKKNNKTIFIILGIILLLIVLIFIF